MNEVKSQRARIDPHAGRPRPFLKERSFHEGLHDTKRLLRGLGMETVCESARCPNIAECFKRPTATFMILGRRCTRKCIFCSVGHATSPDAPASDEPARLAQAAQRLGLRHVVITSVARDDLADEGAGHFAACVAALRQALPNAVVEILTPDFSGDQAAAVERLASQPPCVFNHNIETVARLQRIVRPYAGYDSSLALLRRVAERLPNIAVKSGLMVGLGERWEEILSTMADLRAAGATHLTVGQYFQPTRRNAVVERYYAPEEFDRLAEAARAQGFSHVASGLYVRSSYYADRAMPRANEGEGVTTPTRRSGPHGS